MVSSFFCCKNEKKRVPDTDSRTHRKSAPASTTKGRRYYNGCPSQSSKNENYESLFLTSTYYL